MADALYFLTSRGECLFLNVLLRRRGLNTIGSYMACSKSAARSEASLGNAMAASDFFEGREAMHKATS